MTTMRASSPKTRPIEPRSLPLPPGPRLPLPVQTALLTAAPQRWMPALRKRYGDVFRLNVYPERDVVGIAAPEHLREAFTGAVTTFHAGEGNMALRPVLGEHSVLTTDEDQHRRVRKLLMPPFHGSALREYRVMVDELAEEEVTAWPRNTPFASHGRMQALTLEVILRVVFGVHSGPRLDALRRGLTRLVSVGLLDLLGWEAPALQRFGRWRKHAQLKQRVDDMLYAEIAERRTVTDLDERGDVLSRLLAVSAEDDRLSDVELRDQLITLLVAGHETTATALAWTFHELARMPQQQDAAVRAADSGDTDYLEAVVKEAMRVRPVVYLIARKLTEDIELGGYRIPAGFTIMPAVGLAHRDPANHDSPDEFRPERFVDGNPPSTAWLPFGGGVRRCLGAGFSLLEATVVLRAVLARYRLTPERTRPEPTRPRHVTLVPGKGARIIATPR